MKHNLGNAVSGLALGALVGFLIGLSISQVVGIVLGALTSLLVTFFGLRDTQEAENTNANRTSKLLIASFSIGCFAFIILGIQIRNRNALAPSAEYYKKELGGLYLDSNQVKRIVLLKKYGILMETVEGSSMKSEPSAQVNSSLFSSINTEKERLSIIHRFDKLSLNELGEFMLQQGLGYSQFFNTVDNDITDTTVKKNILLQLIALTYNEKANQ